MIRRPIKVVLRTLNTLVNNPHRKSVTEVSPMTDRKFLQETNFDDDIDFDSESEDRQNDMEASSPTTGTTKRERKR